MILGAVPTGTKPPLSITDSHGSIAQLLAQQFRTEDGTGLTRVRPAGDATRPYGHDQYFSMNQGQVDAPSYEAYVTNWHQTHPNPGGVTRFVQDAADAVQAEMGTGIPLTWLLGAAVVAYFFFTRKP